MFVYTTKAQEILPKEEHGDVSTGREQAFWLVPKLNFSVLAGIRIE